MASKTRLALLAQLDILEFFSRIGGILIDVLRYEVLVEDVFPESVGQLAYRLRYGSDIVTGRSEEACKKGVNQFYLLLNSLLVFPAEMRTPFPVVLATPPITTPETFDIGPWNIVSLTCAYCC